MMRLIYTRIPQENKFFVIKKAPSVQYGGAGPKTNTFAFRHFRNYLSMMMASCPAMRWVAAAFFTPATFWRPTIPLMLFALWREIGTLCLICITLVFCWFNNDLLIPLLTPFTRVSIEDLFYKNGLFKWFKRILNTIRLTYASITI